MPTDRLVDAHSKSIQLLSQEVEAIRTRASQERAENENSWKNYETREKQWQDSARKELQSEMIAHFHNVIKPYVETIRKDVIANFEKEMADSRSQVCSASA